MSRGNRNSHLRDQLLYLVDFYGIEEVNSALKEVLKRRSKKKVARKRIKTAKVQYRMPKVLKDIEASDPKKFEILRRFQEQFDDGEVLENMQDVFLFSQQIGVKSVKTKTRRGALAILLRYLIEMPLAEIIQQVGSVDKISEGRRKEGYSVLTEKILRRDW